MDAVTQRERDEHLARAFERALNDRLKFWSGYRPWTVLSLGSAALVLGALAILFSFMFVIGSVDTCFKAVEINNTELGSMVASKVDIWPLLRTMQQNGLSKENRSSTRWWAPFSLSSRGSMCKQKVCLVESRADRIQDSGYVQTSRQRIIQQEGMVTDNYWVLLSKRKVKSKKRTVGLIAAIPKKMTMHQHQNGSLITPVRICGFLDSGLPDFVEENEYKHRFNGVAFRPMILLVKGRNEDHYSHETLDGVWAVLVCILVPVFQILYNSWNSLISNFQHEQNRAERWRQIAAEARADRLSVWRSPEAIVMLSELHADQQGLIAWILHRGRDRVLFQSTVDRLPTQVVDVPKKDHSECAICCMEYEIGDVVLTLPCGGGRHMFHKQCVGKWLTSCSATCPLCRYPILEEF